MTKLQDAQTALIAELDKADEEVFSRWQDLFDNVVNLHHYGPGAHPSGTGQDVHGGEDEEIKIDPSIGYRVDKIEPDPDARQNHTEFYVSPDEVIYRTPNGHPDFESYASHLTGVDVDYSKGTTLSSRRDHMLNAGWIRIGVDDFGAGKTQLTITTVSIDKPTLRKVQRLYDADKLAYMSKFEWSAGHSYEGTSEFVSTDFSIMLDAKYITVELEGENFKVIKLNKSIIQHVRKHIQAYFDFATGVYRYIVSGRKVPDRYLALGNIRVAKAQAEVMREISTRFLEGEITQQAWYNQMRKAMKDQYRAAYLASIGGVDNYNRSEAAKLGWRVRPQYRWLDNFLLQIQTGQQPMNGNIVRRAGMYARAGNAIYQNHRLELAEQAGFTEAKRILGATDNHCHPRNDRPGCVELAALGYVPIATAVPIGDASCYSHCLCTYIFRKK